MVLLNILRTMGQRTILPTIKKLLVDTLPSSRNLRLDSRLYHATPRRFHEVRKSQPATIWQKIENSADRGMNHQWFYPSAIILGSILAFAQTLGPVPGTEESLRRQRIWSHLMEMQRLSILILAREARKAKGENKAEDGDKAKDAEDAVSEEDAKQGLGWQGFKEERRILILMKAAWRSVN